MNPRPVTVTCYSDVLCIWAYVAEVRLEELRRNLGGDLRLEPRFVSVFGNPQRKIGEGWADRRGWTGYAEHVREIAESFGHVEVHPEVWTGTIPAGSASPHAVVKAVALLEGGASDDTGRVRATGQRSTAEELAWQLRLAFFRDARDIARLDTQLDVARSLGIAPALLRKPLEDGRAQAALADDYDEANRARVQGSPTYILNEGRQRLYGNVGYRILEANIQELLREPRDTASWC